MRGRQGAALHKQLQRMADTIKAVNDELQLLNKKFNERHFRGESVPPTKQ